MWKPNHIVENERVQRMSFLPYEVVLLFFLTENAIYASPLKKGNETNVNLPSIQEIVQGCAYAGTHYVVLLHNHPNTNFLFPSREDIVSTMMYKALLEKYNVILHDHIIISEGGMQYSFKQHGIL